MLNPQNAFPVGGPNYDGTGFANSGIIDTKGNSWSLTFTKAGTYTYVCVIHAPQGMFGKVTVIAAGGASPPASLPNTGGDTTSPLRLLIGAGLLLVLLGALMIGAWRRRAV